MTTSISMIGSRRTGFALRAGVPDAAYGVCIALILVYVAIRATKLSRIERELEELNELADRREPRA